jgi:acyl carrier protein
VVDRGTVLELVMERIRAVMVLDDVRLSEATRFDEDLHADSLDLVEVVESVERELRDRGVPAALPDDELTGVRTVGDVADRIVRHTG